MSATAPSCTVSTPDACADNTEVILYQIDKGGHTWPGGKQYLPKAVIGSTTGAFDGSQVIAQFFVTHGRD